jgi:hypothetical protein
MPIANLPKLVDLQHVFVSEEETIKYLQDKGILLKSGMVCEHCNVGNLFPCKPKVLRCSKNECRKKISIAKNTFFHGSKVPMNTILAIGYDILAGSRTQEIMIRHGLSHNTITDWCGFYRDLLGQDIEFTTRNEKIGGPGIVVEVDESKFGKRKYHRGHKVEGVWVIGGVERTASRSLFVAVVPDRSALTILDLLTYYVQPGSIVYTDCWKGYREEDLLKLGCTHVTVNHEEYFVDPITGCCTNTIEGTWNGIKLRVPPAHRTKKFIQGELELFCWKRRFGHIAWERLMHVLKVSKYDSANMYANYRVNDENEENESNGNKRARLGDDEAIDFVESITEVYDI